MRVQQIDGRARRRSEGRFTDLLGRGLAWVGGWGAGQGARILGQPGPESGGAAAQLGQTWGRGGLEANLERVQMAAARLTAEAEELAGMAEGLGLDAARDVRQVLTWSGEGCEPYALAVSDWAARSARSARAAGRYGAEALELRSQADVLLRGLEFYR